MEIFSDKPFSSTPTRLYKSFKWFFLLLRPLTKRESKRSVMYSAEILKYQSQIVERCTDLAQTHTCVTFSSRLLCPWKVSFHFLSRIFISFYCIALFSMSILIKQNKCDSKLGTRDFSFSFTLFFLSNELTPKINEKRKNDKNWVNYRFFNTSQCFFCFHIFFVKCVYENKKKLQLFISSQKDLMIGMLYSLSPKRQQWYVFAKKES
jgi:hypothetical protein